MPVASDLVKLNNSIKDVTQFWTIFDAPIPIVTHFISKALVTKILPLKTVTSFMDDPLIDTQQFQNIFKISSLLFLSI